MNTVKVVAKRNKRRGQGYGTGVGGHTSGRGQKGQKSRGSIGILFEGMKTKKSLLHRLPFLRGKLKNRGWAKPMPIKIEQLNKLAVGTKVDLESLIKAGIVTADSAKHGIKILAGGKLEKKLEVNVPVSESVKKLIEAAGGSVITVTKVAKK
jgi:large subunit ribosomal protein L15